MSMSWETNLRAMTLFRSAGPLEGLDAKPFRIRIGLILKGVALQGHVQHEPGAAHAGTLVA